MAISQAQSVSASGASTASLTWTTTANNLLMVVAYGTSASATIATPTGWTSVTGAQTIGTGSRPCYVFAKIASGGTGDQQSFVASAGTCNVEAFEFASGGGAWTIGTTQGTNWSLGQNITGTSVTATSLTTPASTALVFYAGVSQASTATSISSTVGSGGTNPSTPSGAPAGFISAWESSSSAVASAAVYTDNGANNRTLFQVTATVSASSQGGNMLDCF